LKIISLGVLTVPAAWPTTTRSRSGSAYSRCNCSSPLWCTSTGLLVRGVEGFGRSARLWVRLAPLRSGQPRARLMTSSAARMRKAQFHRAGRSPWPVGR
jgi:hypothetical protein